MMIWQKITTISLPTDLFYIMTQSSLFWHKIIFLFSDKKIFICNKSTFLQTKELEIKNTYLFKKSRKQWIPERAWTLTNSKQKVRKCQKAITPKFAWNCARRWNMLIFLKYLKITRDISAMKKVTYGCKIDRVFQ